MLDLLSFDSNFEQFITDNMFQNWFAGKLNLK